MKAKGILNRELIRAIADMGHEQIMVIGDAGVPILDDKKRIDLAISKDLPSIEEVLKLILDELICEEIFVAQEQKLYNPRLFETVQNLSKRCQIKTVAHSELFEIYLPKAKYILRTGSFEPWGNIVLVSGIDAPRWFEKKDCVTPDYYVSRVNYEE